jgi:hypothetical protein
MPFEVGLPEERTCSSSGFGRELQARNRLLRCQTDTLSLVHMPLLGPHQNCRYLAQRDAFLLKANRASETVETQVVVEGSLCLG